MKKIYLFIKSIEDLGVNILIFINAIGKSLLFLLSIIPYVINIFKSSKSLIKQIYFIGFLSLGLIIVSGLFIGMVVGLQSYSIIEKFGTEEIIGQMTSLSIIRELGPVVSAILFVGRTGTALTAELCLMKSTDQLSSMEMMGISYLEKVVMPKFLSGLICMFFLTVIFIIVAIIGSYFATVVWFNMDHDIFWNSVKNNVDFKIDILNGLIKSLVFGFIVMWISLFQGLNSVGTVEGISKATTNTVVYSTFIILCLNFFLTALMFAWK